MKLYVGNLSYSTTEDDLRNLFAGAGTVSTLEIIKDRYTGESKGFAFVEMSSQSESENAIKLYNSYSLDNREIKVSIARPREERSFGGYNDRGGGNYGNRGQGGRGGRDRKGGGGGTRRY